MPAIIDHSVEYGNLGAKPRPEIHIGLVADEDLSLRIFIDAARWFYINTVNGRSRPKIVSPHIEAATAVHSDFQYPGISVAKACKMLLIDVEIVLPLPDFTSVNAAVENS